MGVDYPGKTSANGPNWAGYLTKSKDDTIAYVVAEGGATVDQSIVTTFLPLIKSFRQQVEHWASRFDKDGGWNGGSEALMLMWFGINDINRSYGVSHVFLQPPSDCFFRHNSKNSG